MTIKGDDFKLVTSLDTYADAWDVIMKVPTKNGKREKTICYGVNLNHAIQVIINTKIRLHNDVITMEDYLQQYKDNLKSLDIMVNDNKGK
mgnify:CR=1 FL=1